MISFIELSNYFSILNKENNIWHKMPLRQHSLAKNRLDPVVTLPRVGVAMVKTDIIMVSRDQTNLMATVMLRSLDNHR